MGKRRFVAGLVGVGCLVGLCGLSAVPAQAAELPYERLSGPSGVETSLAVAKHVYPGAWNVVYVASNRNPVDALPAATIGDGPVVLTDGKTLNLGGVKPGKIVLLGGVGAVPQAVEAQAKATGAEVIRLAGADRNMTAQRIAQRWMQVNGHPSNVYVTKNAGSGSPDAVAASVLRDGPILTFTNDANAAALSAVVAKLGPSKVTALGGVGPVSEANLKTIAGGKATARLAGSNRYETAFAIAKVAKSQNGGSNIYLASGTALKDAMVAGAAKDGQILLTPANGAGVNEKAVSLGASKIIAIGGTGVLPDITVKAAATGIIPVKSAKDMTIDEMRANLTKVSADPYVKYKPAEEGSSSCSGTVCGGTSSSPARVYFKAMPPRPTNKGDYLFSTEFDPALGYLDLNFPDWKPTTPADYEDYDHIEDTVWGGGHFDFSKSGRMSVTFGLEPTFAGQKLWFEEIDPTSVNRLPEGSYVEYRGPYDEVLCGASGGYMKCFVWATDSPDVPAFLYANYDQALRDGAYD